MASYLSGKLGIIASPTVSVKRSRFGNLGCSDQCQCANQCTNCPNQCPTGYSYDAVRNVCVLNSVSPIAPVIMAGKKLSCAW